MAVKEYEENGTKLWMVYVNIRHPNLRGMRRQRKIKGFKSESAALQEEKKLLTRLSLEMAAETERGPTWQWNKGEQARVLRMFCQGIGLRSVCFHTLRACFATQLLANDVAPARIMKICGWRDLKTMQHYVRLAGVDERGATETLRVLPSDAAVMAEVVNIFDFRRRDQ